MKSGNGDFLPGALLIIAGLYGILRLVLERRNPRSETSKPARWRLLFAAASRLGIILLGLDLLSENLDLALKSLNLGTFGILLILVSLTYSGVAALSKAAAHAPEGAKGPAAGAWIAWVILSPIGYMLGFFLVPALLIATGTGPSFRGLSPVVGSALIGLSIGLLTGLAQWLVLRLHFDRAGRWVWVTALGFALGFVVDRNLLDAYGGREAPIAIVIIARILRGALVAAPQWLVLRSWSTWAIAWIPINSLAHLAGYGVTEWLVPAQTSGSFSGKGEGLNYVKGILLSGAVHAVITATGLLKLARTDQAK